MAVFLLSCILAPTGYQRGAIGQTHFVADGHCALGGLLLIFFWWIIWYMETCGVEALETSFRGQTWMADLLLCGRVSSLCFLHALALSLTGAKCTDSSPASKKKFLLCGRVHADRSP